VVEIAFIVASGLYRIPIQPPIVASFALSSKDNKVSLWHGRLDHLGSTLLRKILPCIIGHNLQLVDVNSMTLCQACVQGKLIAKPSLWKLSHELTPMFSRLHGDIYGPITPMTRPFRFFWFWLMHQANNYMSHYYQREIWLLPIYFPC